MEKELTAKERVQFELDELYQKIGKLSLQKNVIQ